MIKVIVAVSGLVLVQVHGPNGPIDLHFPDTSVFAAPVLSAQGKPAPMPMPKHSVNYWFGEDNQGRAVQGSDARGFWIQVDGPSGGGGNNVDLTEAKWFPRLDRVLPGAHAQVRTDCQFGEAALRNCQGLNLKGQSAPLLAGQIRLTGKWRMIPADTAKNAHEPQNQTGDRAPLMRLLIDDEGQSEVHISSGRTFADTFAFVTEVSDEKDLGFAVNGGATQRLTLRRTNGGLCGAGETCDLLWIENVPPGGGHSDGSFLGRGDTHFSQLYRFLTTYLPRSGELQDKVYVPFSVDDRRIHGTGDHSPRCYGGLVVQ